MKNAVLVCLLIVLAIGSIAAVAEVNLSNSFLEVKDVHDLFEIFGVFATISAVGIALYGLNTWKIQLGAASDHELARRLAICVRRYRIAVVSAWHAAESSAVQIEGKTWIGPGGSDNFLIGIYKSRIDEVQRVRAELESVALESAAIWHGVFETGFDMIYAIDLKCCNCIDSYLGLLIRGDADDRAFDTADAALKHWSEFKQNGVIDDKSIKKLFDLKSSEVAREIGRRLLSGRN